MSYRLPYALYDIVFAIKFILKINPYHKYDEEGGDGISYQTIKINFLSMR